MDTQVTHMYQRNFNEQGPTGRQPPPNPGNGDDTNGNNPQKKGISPLKVSLLMFALVAFVAAGYIFLACQASNMNAQPVGELPYSSFYQQVMIGNVENAIFQGQDVTGNLRNATQLMDPRGNTILTNHYHFTQIPNGDPN